MKVLIYYFMFLNFETCQSRISLVLISMLNHLIRCVHQLKWGELRNQRKGNYSLYPVLSLEYETNWFENKRKYPAFMLHASLSSRDKGRSLSEHCVLLATEEQGPGEGWGLCLLGHLSVWRWSGWKVSVQGEDMGPISKIYYSLTLLFNIQFVASIKYSW